MASEGELRSFMRRRRMVRFERPFEPWSTTGHVVGVGPDLFALLHVDHAIRYDGFQVLRNRDIRRLLAHPRTAFVEAALSRRKDRRPTTPRLRLADLRQVIRSAGRHFPLVTIHRERARPDVCHIGAVVDVGERRVTLREITPDATWEDELSDYPLREITRVDFGGSYEDALLVVGGSPPRTA